LQEPTETAAATALLENTVPPVPPAVAIAQAANTRHNDRRTAAPARPVNTSQAHQALAGDALQHAQVVNT